MERKVIDTGDGSKTLYLPEMDEQYHSVKGALTESEYVFIEKGYLYHPSKMPVVFEVGFGTGLNCLLTALQAEKLKRKTTYIAIEKFPVEKELLAALGYGRLISEEAREVYKKIHGCPWDVKAEITPNFSLLKIKGDLPTHDLTGLEKCDVVYFDAFGPDKQPAMWTPAIFRKIYPLCSNGAVFVTYSAKGEVRRQLAACSFEMERLPGPPGKKQMLRGTKK